MAYGKLVEDARCLTVAATDQINYQDINEIADQSKRVLGPREYVFFPGGVTDAGGAQWFPDSSTPTSVRTTSDSALFLVPLVFRAGSVVYSVSVCCAGTNTCSDGAIYIEQNPKGGGAPSFVDITDGVTDMWDTGGAAPTVYGDATNYYCNYTQSGMPMTMLEDYYYMLIFESASDLVAIGGGADNKLFYYSVVVGYDNY
jgi:hypothetical protein